MADINKIKLPSGTEYNIKDYRIPGVDSTPTSGSDNVVTSDGVYNSIKDFESFYFVQGSSSQAGSSTSGAYLSTKWEGTVPGVSTVYNGLKIAYRIATNTGVGTAGAVLSIDGTNYYPVVVQKNSIVSTMYPVGSTILMVFNSTQTATAYLTSNTKSTVTGCWQIMEYDSNTNTYQREYVSSDNTEYPITTRYATTSGSSYYAEYGRYSEGVTLNPSTNTITASSFKTTNGTSSQVLKADGSVGTIESTPTENSTNLVTSGGVYSAINTAIGSVYRVKGTKADYASLPSSGNVAGDVWNVTAAYGNYPAGTNWVWTGTEWDALGGAIDLSGKQDVLTFDSTPTANSTNPVTSGGIYTAINNAKELECLSYFSAALRPDGVTAADLQGAYTAATAALTAGKLPYLKITCAYKDYYLYLDLKDITSALRFHTLHKFTSSDGNECDYYYIVLESNGTISAGAIPLVQHLTTDSTPTQNSTNLISSGGVYTAIENSQLWEAGTGTNSVQIKNMGCSATGTNSVAEGYRTVASGQGAHSEGYAQQDTNEDSGDVYSGILEATGKGAHAGGFADGEGGDEGYGIIRASGVGSFAHGSTSYYADSDGSKIIASGEGSVAVGYANEGNILSNATGAFAGGDVDTGLIKANGSGSIAFGTSFGSGSIISSGAGAIAMGNTDSNQSITSSGWGSTAIGFANTGEITASGDGAVAIGEYTRAFGKNSMCITNNRNNDACSLGSGSLSKGGISFGDRSIAIGDNCISVGTASIAIGNDGCCAEGTCSIAIGQGSDCAYGTATCNLTGNNSTGYSGYYVRSKVWDSYVIEGNVYKVSSITNNKIKLNPNPGTLNNKFAKVYTLPNYSNGDCWCGSIGDYSVAIGNEVITKNDYEVGIGQFNDSHSDTVFSVGVGDSSERKNALEIIDTGDCFLYGVGGYVEETDPVHARPVQDVINEKIKGVTFNGTTATVTNGIAAITASIPTIPSIDSSPTANSTNLVTSGGVYTAIESAKDLFVFDITYDESDGTVTTTTTFAEIYAAITNGKYVIGNINVEDDPKKNVMLMSGYLYDEDEEEGDWGQIYFSWDQGSGNPASVYVNIYDSWEVYDTNLSIDSVPTQYSYNAVSSGGVYNTINEFSFAVSTSLNDLNDRITTIENNNSSGSGSGSSSGSGSGSSTIPYVVEASYNLNSNDGTIISGSFSGIVDAINANIPVFLHARIPKQDGELSIYAVLGYSEVYNDGNVTYPLYEVNFYGYSGSDFYLFGWAEEDGQEYTWVFEDGILSDCVTKTFTGDGNTNFVLTSGVEGFSINGTPYILSGLNKTGPSGSKYIATTDLIPAAPGTLNTNNTTAQTASSSEALSGTINLHKVSKTGSYNDLLNKPTIPSAPGTLITNATTAQTVSSGEAMSGSITLHKVAKTGTYSDLIGIPNELFAAGDGTSGVKQVSIPSYNVTSGNGAIALNNASTSGNNSLSANSGIARGIASTAIGQGLSIGASSFASGVNDYYNTGYKYSGSGTSFTVTITSSQLEAILGFTDIVGLTGRFGTGNNVTTAVIISASWSSSDQLDITTSKDIGTHTNEDFYIYVPSTANGRGSHAEGNGTITLNNFEHSDGQYNASTKIDNTFGTAGNTLYSLGIGTSPVARANAVEVKQNGDIFIKGIGSYNGTNYSTASSLQTVIGNIPSAVTESTVSGWGFTKNSGTITGINMNGASKGTSGVVDLGTVITSHAKHKLTTTNGTATSASGTITYVESLTGTTTATDGDLSLTATRKTITVPSAPGTLNTTATTAQNTAASEALSGSITLHKVAKTGTYSDLIGTPTIPTVNNSTISIQKGGTAVDSFTTNASSAKTINIPNELPSYSSSDSGKVLSVNSSGQLVWITPAQIYSGSGTPSNSTGNNGDIYVQS